MRRVNDPEFTSEDLKKLIEYHVIHAADDLIYDDRIGNDYEDTYLPLGKIQEAIKSGIISLDEIVKLFSDTLTELVNEYMNYSKYEVNQVVVGVVKEITEWGIFLELEQGVSGYLQDSDIDGRYQIDLDEKIECRIRSIDLVRNTITLSRVSEEVF